MSAGAQASQLDATLALARDSGAVGLVPGALQSAAGQPVAHKVADALGWVGLLRLALVQASLGAVVVLATSTLNRVMIIELGLPAAVPAALVALHYLVQGFRPRVGFGADRAGRCTPWIIGGVLLLATGGFLAALGTALVAGNRMGGLALALLGYVAIGLGVGTAGTSNMALLAKRVGAARRALAATVTWVMMIAGFGLSAGLAGHFLQPYSPLRLVQVQGCVSLVAVLVACLAVRGVERRVPNLPRGALAEALAGTAVAAADAAAATGATPGTTPGAVRGRFGDALRALLRDPQARAFTLFLFLSMLAFSAQELLLESFAGLVFGFTPGRSAQLASLEHGGVLAGMISVALLASRMRSRSLRGWMVLGTCASAVGIAVLAAVGAWAIEAWLAPVVFLLGLANGCFAVAALGSMMELSVAAGRGQEGLRMGVWGAAQALAFAIGGLTAGAAIDIARGAWHQPGVAYACAFACASLLFAAAAVRAFRLSPAPAGAKQGVSHEWR
jgi:BCD family chlorophyll transporter-like MFS transporter